VRVTTEQPTSPQRIVDLLASMSWIAGMPASERDAMLRRMRALVFSGHTPDLLPLHFVFGLTAVR
jgi:hypothetical protein